MSWNTHNLNPYPDAKQTALAPSIPLGPNRVSSTNVLKLGQGSFDQQSLVTSHNHPRIFPDAPLDFDLSNSPSSTPPSTALISPKSSISPPSRAVHTEDNDTAIEVLRRHHLDRFHHYRNLALEAEAGFAKDRLGLDHASMSGEPYKSDGNNMMASYHSQAPPAPSYYGVPHVSGWNHGYPYAQQSQDQAAAMHAQAQAHMQAHDAALARAQHQRSAMTQVPYYMTSQRQSFEGVNAPHLWSRHSVSTTSGQSPPYQAAPAYSVHSVVKSENAIGPYPTDHLDNPRHPHVEGENELDDEDELDGVDGKNQTNSIGIANSQGGGRGYIPGKTPEDPKKRHKCQICGRGFARAFNLKSHVQTHNPLRSKPHQCPHPSCKRGFSRLHDLERHRQGIHSDGPLVEAKRLGVPPAVARAQSRIQRRAESGGLI